MSMLPVNVTCLAGIMDATELEIYARKNPQTMLVVGVKSTYNMKHAAKNLETKEKMRIIYIILDII